MSRIDNLLDEYAEQSRALRESFRLAVVTSDLPPISCARGCAGCCHQLIVASFLEGCLLARALRANEQHDLLDALVAQGGAQFAPYEADRLGFAERWFNSSKPACALLVSQQCAAYDHRPAACSTYYVVSPPHNCAPPSGKSVGQVNNEQAILAAALLDMRFTAALLDEPARLPAMPLGVAVGLGCALLDDGVDGLHRALQDVEETCRS